MKFISIILSILILFAGFLPCAGSSNDCCTATSADIENVCLEKKSEQQNDDETKDCGANCLCFCCGAVYIFTKKFDSNSEFTFIKAPSSFNKFNYKFSYSQIVWHPPIA